MNELDPKTFMPIQIPDLHRVRGLIEYRSHKKDMMNIFCHLFSHNAPLYLFQFWYMKNENSVFMIFSVHFFFFPNKWAPIDVAPPRTANVPPACCNC